MRDKRLVIAENGGIHHSYVLNALHDYAALSAVHCFRETIFCADKHVRSVTWVTHLDSTGAMISTLCLGPRRAVWRLLRSPLFGP